MEGAVKREPSSDSNPYVLAERNAAQRETVVLNDGSIHGGSPVESLYGRSESERDRRKVEFYTRRQNHNSHPGLARQHSISPYTLPSVKLPKLPSAGLLEMVSSFKRTLFNTSRKERDVENPIPEDAFDGLMSPNKLNELRAHSTSKFLGGGGGGSSHRVEFKLIRDALNFMSDDEGGEGVHYIQASKKAGSGYWMASILAIRGRPFGIWPMLIYMMYTVLVVCLVQRHITTDPLVPSQPSTNAISTGGSINGTQSTTQIIQGLQSCVYLISTALFFLQTFRTNHSYNRWWEGRCLWAMITAHILTISRTIAGGSLRSQKLGRRMLRWSAAFLIALKASLRGEDDLEDLDGLLNSAELSALEVKQVDFRPLLCLQNIQEAWGLSQDDKLIRECASKELEKVMPDLSTGMMGLKRIATTSMPFGYVSHLRSFLVIWLCLLPFVFVYQMSYWAIGICFIIAYSLLGMEVLSLELESPFGRDFNHLPMDSMTKQTLSELFESYATTVNLPQAPQEVLAPASAEDEEQEPALLYRSKRSTASSKKAGGSLARLQSHHESHPLVPVPEDSTQLSHTDGQDIKNPMFSKKSWESYQGHSPVHSQTLRAEKSTGKSGGGAPSFQRSSLGEPAHETQGLPPRSPPRFVGSNK